MACLRRLSPYFIVGGAVLAGCGNNGQSYSHAPIVSRLSIPIDITPPELPSIAALYEEGKREVKNSIVPPLVINKECYFILKDKKSETYLWRFTPNSITQQDTRITGGIIIWLNKLGYDINGHSKKAAKENVFVNYTPRALATNTIAPKIKQPSSVKSVAQPAQTETTTFRFSFDGTYFNVEFNRAAIEADTLFGIPGYLEPYLDEAEKAAVTQSSTSQPLPSP